MRGVRPFADGQVIEACVGKCKFGCDDKHREGSAALKTCYVNCPAQCSGAVPVGPSPKPVPKDDLDVR